MEIKNNSINKKLKESYFSDLIKKVSSITHNSYNKRLQDWRFFDETCSGGRNYVEKHLIKEITEENERFEKRKEIAFFPNYSQEVIRILVSYLCGKNNVSNREKYPEEIKKIYENIDLEGNNISEFFEQVGTYTLKYGMCAIFCDSTRVPKELIEKKAILTKADEKELGLRPYLKCLTPYEIPYYSQNDLTKEINWIILKEKYFDDSDLNSSFEQKERFLYIDKSIKVLIEDGVIIDEVINELNEVPITFITTEKVKVPYESVSIIEDISRIDKNIMNNLSLLDRIIVNQTFSIKVVEEGDGEEIKKEDVNDMNISKTQVIPKGSKMYYISPDATQAGVILNKVDRDINEIYRKVSLMSNNDTKQESGIAKSFNYSNFNSLLGKIATMFENSEKKSLISIGKMMGIKEIELQNIDPKYTKIFDIFSIQQDLLTALDILTYLYKTSKTGYVKLLSKLSFKTLPDLTEEEKQIINKEIEKNYDKMQLSESEEVQDSDKSKNTGAETVSANLNTFERTIKNEMDKVKINA